MHDQTPELNDLSHRIIKCAMKTHSLLGPGLLEKVYEESLHYFLVKEGLKSEKQKEISINLDEVKLECGFKADLLVENQIIIELKSVELLHPIHQAQLMTYLKLSGLSLGLLMNFNVTSMKDGIKRIVYSNKLRETPLTSR
jgi:GxxExxY protein